MIRSVIFAISLSILTPVYQLYAEEIKETMKRVFIDEAKPYADFRYRYENVDQKGIVNTANASTLRTKLGYKTGSLYDFSAVLEFENISYLGDDHFNNTINGKTDYPVIADPNSTELNHAFLTYTGLKDTVFQIGRQPHNIDNQRFVGTVGWRQNDQSYDSVAIINHSLPKTSLVYAYVKNVNRIFSDEHPFGDLDTNSHIINLSYNGLKYGKLTGYGYLIDLDDRAIFGLSSQTFGLRFSGSMDIKNNLRLLYTAEYANQSNYGNNPNHYSANYYHLKGGFDFKGFNLALGYEVLGSDKGNFSFSTPLATLHKFNGWADKFLSTPRAGLQDFYVSAAYKFQGIHALIDTTKLTLVYHDFSTDNGGDKYGSEWDIALERRFTDYFSVLLKYADYKADHFSTDTRKIWVQLRAKF